MKSAIRFFSFGFLSLCLATFVHAQSSPTTSTTSTSTTTTTSSSADKSAVAGATNSARTDVYTVHFTHAALGKAAELGES